MDLWVEVQAERYHAHLKHGANSIEGEPANSPRWLPILLEEVGEVAAELTYDKGRPGGLRAELVQVVAVASAWVDALDRPASGKPHRTCDCPPDQHAYGGCLASTGTQQQDRKCTCLPCQHSYGSCVGTPGKEGLLDD